MASEVEPRLDGRCIDCEQNDAVTNDKLLCKKCLRKRLKDGDPYDPKSMFSDQRGRSARSSAMLGGAADMRTTEEMD